jgi:hypothetical protein
MVFCLPRLSSRKASAARWVRPHVEWLESRHCPSCVITTLSATAEPGLMVQVSGTVQDLNPFACSVTFSGVINGSVAVNADGTFSAEFSAKGPGLVIAVAQDNQQQLMSAAVATAVAPEAPVIQDFDVVHVLNTSWMISGQVIDQSPGGLSVVFGGPGYIEGSTAPTDNSGNFSLAVTVSAALPDFTITAQVTDALGLTSQLVSTTVNNSY